MSYFSSFPYVLYPNFVDETGNVNLILKNITTRIVRRESLIDDKSVFYKYFIRAGEDIESISNDLYKTPMYYWTIMIINNKFDRFYDFPLQYGEFEDYIADKYGSISGAQTTYKYFIRESYERFSDDVVEDKNYFLEVPVNNYLYTNIDSQTSRAVSENGRLMKYSKSNYEIEEEANEAKRNILVCDSRYIGIFVDTFRSLL
jgi:hypothetical protein